MGNTNCASIALITSAGSSPRTWGTRAIAGRGRDDLDRLVTTMKVLKKFVEISEKHTPYLLRKAQRIEEYLDQH